MKFFLVATRRTAGAGTPAPALSSLNFDLSDTLGGDPIVITGTNLTAASSVTVGGLGATITANTATSLTFTMPARTAGLHNVQVTTAGGASNTLAIEAWAPDSMQLTGYVRKNYTASPWVGQPSASGGLSSAHNFTGGTAPSAVSGDASFVPTQSLAGAQIDNFINNNLGSFAILFKANTVGPGDGTSPTRYVGRTIFSDSAGAGYLHIGHNAAGVYLSIYTSAYNSVIAPITTTTNWTLVQVRITNLAGNVTIEVRANNGSWVPLGSLGVISLMTGAATFGTGFGSAAYDGLIREFISGDYAMTDTEFNKIRRYANCKYQSLGVSV